MYTKALERDVAIYITFPSSGCGDSKLLNLVKLQEQGFNKIEAIRTEQKSIGSYIEYITNIYIYL